MTEQFFNEQTEQSLVKGEIVANYFDAWAQIITATLKRAGRSQRIGYVDLFAGPGRYEDGALSTPVKVLEKAIARDAYREHLVTIFNDKNPDNVGSLTEEIKKLPGIETLQHEPIIWNREVGPDIAKEFESTSNIPLLAFIDPWGYKGLSLQLIQAFLRDWGCDCILFFNYSRINAGLNNEAVREHMEALFGVERVKTLAPKLEKMSPEEREAAIVEELAQALKEFGHRYVLPFCFKNQSGRRTKHHLVLVTKSFKGYEVMKEVMAKASSESPQGVASFTFSPAASTRQKLLFDLNRPLDELGAMLLDEFAGQRITMEDLYKQHSVDRPYTSKNYKTVLRELEDEGKITTEGRRSNRGFADYVVAIFPEAS